ncbi:CBS domain-containing protein [Leisingera aquaemixtae]|uniref:CBS domain-containing protein n=1 Tax=Leisingera aquaemixtae TaxID=1396826 RepID=A0A0N7M4Y8_9RHOB|nr:MULTISPECIES: CBS domain-containing protein [Leisingera]QDI75906.1 CBS domain-containing protein [Leisingera aquaemixtae]UWQ26414.1 CBS domain-containing protein [Leisingera aquaemixtae]UWQ38934.1 CBS domain-containing protein [Leisingera aquaemixtae]UWQ43042.1 CBS domain-containing protein [Leisingera aquaemixtae]UWQ47376.1 CBS domain-containing protein [Leisingera aquaemixtae]
MLVQVILKSKATSGVVTVKPDASVSDAARLLAENKFGSVVVSADGVTPDGILSERDIVRELSKEGAACLDKPVSGYMTRELVTCTTQSNVGELLKQMTEGRFRHMPVVEDGKLVGIVTLGDAVKAQLAQVAMEKDALQDMIMGH